MKKLSWFLAISLFALSSDAQNDLFYPDTYPDSFFASHKLHSKYVGPNSVILSLDGYCIPDDVDTMYFWYSQSQYENMLNPRKVSGPKNLWKANGQIFTEVSRELKSNWEDAHLLFEWFRGRKDLKIEKIKPEKKNLPKSGDFLFALTKDSEKNIKR